MPVTQAGTWNVNNVSGTVSLPSGASTSANQTSEISILTSIDTGIPLALGPTTSVNCMPVVMATDQILSSSPSDGIKQTYAVGINFTIAPSATDFLTFQGSATKIIKIRSMVCYATATTGANVRVFAIRRSTANTGGTFSTAMSAPFDNNNSAPTAIVKSYTANPTALGTTVATLALLPFYISGGGTIGSTPFDIKYDGSSMQPITLRGVSDFFVLNLNSTTVSGNIFTVSINYTEE